MIIGKITKEIMKWQGATSGTDRFGGTEFRILRRERTHAS
jgi:hypothetical protein